MVRFVVEVSEGYISERANMENLEKLVKDKNHNPLVLISEFVAFASLERIVKEDGVTEFNIKFDKDADKEEIKLLNNAIATLAAVATKQKIDSRVTE